MCLHMCIYTHVSTVQVFHLHSLLFLHVSGFNTPYLGCSCPIHLFFLEINSLKLYAPDNKEDDNRKVSTCSIEVVLGSRNKNQNLPQTLYPILSFNFELACSYTSGNTPTCIFSCCRKFGELQY